MRQYSGVQVLSFALLLLGTGACVFAVCTHQWSSYKFDISLDVTQLLSSAVYASGYRGLWRQCNVPRVLTGEATEQCASRFDSLRDNVQHGQFDKTLDEYSLLEVACLALMCASAGLGILSLFVSPCVCHRCGCCLSILVFLAGLCAAAGVGCYTYFHLSGQIKPSLGSMTITDKIVPGSFGYSYWCAVAAAILQIFASLLFAGDSRSHDYSQTI